MSERCREAGEVTGIHVCVCVSRCVDKFFFSLYLGGCKSGCFCLIKVAQFFSSFWQHKNEHKLLFEETTTK